MKAATRRQFLHTASSTAAAAFAGSSSGSSADRGHIDAHVHVWSPDTGRHPLAEGFKKEGMKPASFTPEQLFAHCRPEGVRRIVLIQMSFYRTDNRCMLDAIAAHPGVFKGVAIIDHHRAGVSGRMKELAKQGVSGFRLSPGAEKDTEAWLGSAGMQEMWRTAADERLSICLLINPEALGPVSRMCEKFPRTPVVIDHFARVGTTGFIERADLDRLLHLSAHPEVTVKTSAFYALGKKQPPYLDLGLMIRECRDQFGAKRLMWASDCPFQVNPGHTYRDSIALIRDRLDFLTAEDKEWMLRKTAERVFF